MWTGDSDGSKLVAGKYQIIQPIKTGGTAAIYLAVVRGESQFSREVVIKRPLAHLLADPTLRGMFIDEARVQSRLSHPNIVQVLDLITEGDEVYLVLEYLSGRDLREINKRLGDLGRTFPVDLAVWVGAEMCAGLHFAHEVTSPDGAKLNLVHRDVSPKNVRVTSRGVVKIIDFGIAHFDNRMTETKEGSVKGTLGYMSPEQLMGEVVDRRTDVFAFGICMFQMLTGRNPFTAGGLKERIQKLVTDDIPSVREFDPDIDETLATIVATCLERDLDLRYPSMKAVEDDLSGYLRQLDIVRPRERMVELLEEIFEDIHEPPARLKEALTAISSGWSRDPDRVENSNLGTNFGAAEPSPPTPGPVALPRTATIPTPQVSSLSGRLERSVLIGLVVIVSILFAATVWTLFKPSSSREGEAIGGVVVASVDGGGSDAVSDRGAAKDAAVAAVSSSGSPNPGDAGETPGVASTRDAASGARRTGAGAVRARPRHGQRDYLRAGARLAAQARHRDALLLYQLAYASVPKKRVNPAVYRNLALVYRALDDPAKMRACFNMYLSRHPRARDADQIRAQLAAYPATPRVTCVTSGERRAARKRATRIGAKIEAWISQAGR